MVASTQEDIVIRIRAAIDKSVKKLKELSNVKKFKTK